MWYNHSQAPQKLNLFFCFVVYAMHTVYRVKQVYFLFCQRTMQIRSELKFNCGGVRYVTLLIPHANLSTKLISGFRTQLDSY